jgi:hypothetical protein
MQPVALAEDGFNEAWFFGIVAESPSQLGHDPGQGALGNELDRPHRVDDVLPRHQISQPGKGPTSIFQPVEDSWSRMAFGVFAVASCRMLRRISPRLAGAHCVFAFCPSSPAF